MAEPLKNCFDVAMARRIAKHIQAVYPAFKHRAFIRDASLNLEAMELMPRARHMAAALRQHLPAAYPEAVAILVKSLGPPLASTGNNGMDPFMYLPHVFFVSHYGLDHFEESMAAQYEITQRFTAEFSIRAFLQRYPQQTLNRLQQWATDPNVHVRRLVSEGTRPRLPWAPRLPEFQRDPKPVLPLLEMLKNDEDLYVRRSVANHLNDIGKDNPQILMQLAAEWLQTPTPQVAWVVKHALRFAIKQGDAQALALLGYGQRPKVELHTLAITPGKMKMGKRVEVSFAVRNSSPKAQALMVDLCIFYIKAGGSSAPKVFKLKAIQLAAGAEVVLGKKISVADMTTRKHYPGEHKVAVLINGYSFDVGSFHLRL